MAETKKKERKAKKEKPLERWTVKELREEALKIGGVVGVHGMNKEELLEALRKEKGIEPPASKKKIGNVREIKSKVIELRKKKDEERASDASRGRLNILRKKISRMKKQTRRQA
jgi:hypothetical protein